MSRRERDRDTTVIFRTVARVVLPLILLTAIALLLRGHNLPGGGFIAGVLTAAAFAMLYIAYGSEYLESELMDRRPAIADIAGSGLILDYRRVFAVGLALAAGAGVAAMALGAPFLAQTTTTLHHLPIYGDLHVASALAFDLGVYLVVVGALLAVLGVVGAE